MNMRPSSGTAHRTMGSNGKGVLPVDNGPDVVEARGGLASKEVPRDSDPLCLAGKLFCCPFWCWKTVCPASKLAAEHSNGVGTDVSFLCQYWRWSVKFNVMNIGRH